MQINQAMQHEHNALCCWTSDTLAPTCSRPSWIRDLVVVPPLKAIARATTTTRTIPIVVAAVTGTMRAIVVTIVHTAIVAVAAIVVKKVTTSTITIVDLAKRLNYTTQLKLQLQCFTTCKQVTIRTAIVRPVMGRARTNTRIRTAIGAATASSEYECMQLQLPS